MERISKNNCIRILLIVCGVLYTVSSNAQIGDWIAEKVKGYIYGKVNGIVNSTNAYMGRFGSTLYEGIVEAKTESDLKDKMGEFKRFEPSRFYLNQIGGNYGLTGDQSDYGKLYTKESNFINSIIHSQNDVPLNRLAKGELSNDMQKYTEEIDRTQQISSLSSVLSKVAMDSIKNLDPTMESLLLSDIRNNRKLIYFFNNYPEALRVYMNSIEVEKLRVSIPHLFYWSKQADAHRDKLPSKVKIIDPRRITFVGENKVSIMYNDVVLGIIRDTIIQCNSLDLLNYCGMPNTVYELENQSYVTDAIGRIKVINQMISNSQKGKNKMKSKLKSMNFVSLLAKREKPMLYSPASTKYKGAESFLNTCFVENSKENKNTIKLMKKTEKSYLKASPIISKRTIISYSNGDIIPSNVKIDYQSSDNYFVLSNGEEVVQQKMETFSSNAKTEEISFINSLK